MTIRNEFKRLLLFALIFSVEGAIAMQFYNKVWYYYFVFPAPIFLITILILDCNYIIKRKQKD